MVGFQGTSLLVALQGLGQTALPFSHHSAQVGHLSVVGYQETRRLKATVGLGVIALLDGYAS